MKSLKNLGFIIFFIVNFANAQEIDKSQIVVQYTKSKVRDTIRNKMYVEEMTLLIGSNHSKYFSSKWENFNEKEKKLEANSNPILDENTQRYTRNGVINNFHKGIIQVFESHNNANYVYLQPNNLLQWKTENETKTILGYACQKATAKYRGRNWTAWFATDIPIAEGPWLFKGLPGLVLEASDSQNYFSFAAISLKKEEISITFNASGFEETTKEKVEELNKAYQKQIDNKLAGFYLGPKNINNLTEENKSKLMSLGAYNPLEKPEKTNTK